MHIHDFFPTQGCFYPGQKAILRIELEVSKGGPIDVELLIRHLAGPAVHACYPMELAPGRQQVDVAWMPPAAAPAGYAVQAVVTSEREGSAQASTAFDVLPDWHSFPRYGFLTDFSPARNDGEETIETLARYHINGLQFYDWQYRHDALVAPTQEYSDPLGRRLSLATVRTLIQAAHRHNIAAMPYLAIYAASASFWEDHPEWALYDAHSHPIPFGEDFLGLMDPTPGKPWAGHLMEECARALESLPFDGLHIDQYGDPKEGWSCSGERVDLPEAFSRFIRDARGRFPTKTVLFNAVGNWPIETLAAAPENFEYIEVWPPQTALADLKEIVQGARARSGGRPVVVALYLPADRPANILLADALIFACGGSRIELGEQERLLADPYFPKHQEIPSELRGRLRQYYDFAVRYGEWTGPFAADVSDVRVEVRGEVAWAARKGSRAFVLNLVNLAGLGPTPRWDEALDFPEPLQNVPVSMDLPAEPARVWWAAPEMPPETSPQPLDFSYSSGRISLTLPELTIWSLIAIEW